MWFVKSKRAQTVDDYETWIEGGVVPTLNAFDVGDTRAVTLVLFEATRVDDVRIHEKISPTVPAYWGTGGARVPYVVELEGVEMNDNPTAYSLREDAKANNFSATETDTALTLQAHQPSVQSHHAQLFIAQSPLVRRLMPIECERLQGFPDEWTAGQADSHRYKQMGNAVAVPVVEWIISNMVSQ
jgi:site-specific DNA-cytosine methylase